MNTRSLNIILVVAIILVLGFIAFLIVTQWNAPRLPFLGVSRPPGSELKTIVNRGEESEKRDRAMEEDVLKISAAVQAYAKDHQGRYPESDFRNPCSGVRMCLKGADINTAQKAYLSPIPQTKPGYVDYYYRSDNIQKTYCVRTPMVLETAPTLYFECTEVRCGKVLYTQICQ